jgi:hypothetical protein
MPDYIPILNEILDHVDGEPGWQVLGIAAAPDENLPGFAYTVGLFANFHHPEILVFGLPISTAHQLLNELGHRIKTGEVISSDCPYTDIVQGYPVLFKPIKAEFLEDYFGIAMRFYGQAQFTALQMCWTDKATRYPWEEGFDPQMKLAQPLLF